jgi:hypothetical protein
MKNSSGNALVYILIAVGLLAALSGAVMRGGGGSVSKLTDDQKKLHATDIITYANTIANAVSQLKLRGISNSQLSFASPNKSDYGTFDDAARAEVFNPSGGGIVYTEPNDAALISAFTQYEFYTGNAIDGIGTTCADDDCADLVFFVEDIKADVCVKINEIVGVTNTNDEPPVEPNFNTAEQFSGSFVYQETITGDSDELIGQKEACFINTSGDTYGHYYKVLIAQ